MSIPRITKRAKEKLKAILAFLFLSLILLRLGSYLYAHTSSFEKFNPEVYQKAYLGSTHARKGGAPVSDYIVYGHAAWEYIHGKNPTLINPETPPLGKYLMGISILLFQRIAVGSVIFGLLSLLLVFLIGKIILRSTSLSLIPVALLTFEPLFIKQLDTALLETYHLFFILLAFYFFLLTQKKDLPTGRQEKFFIFTSLALGGIIAVKFYSTGVIIVLSWIVFLVLNKNYSALIKLLISLPLAILVLMASYFKIFLEGESLRRFFGIQKWIFHFYSGGKFLVPPGSVWQLVFLKKWVTWWADRRPLPAPDWQITWPVSIIISLELGIVGLINLLKPKNILKSIALPKEAQILTIWVFVYLASLSFGIIYPRYLLPLLPFAFILSLCFLKDAFCVLKAHRFRPGRP